MYRSEFATDRLTDRDGHFMVWHGGERQADSRRAARHRPPSRSSRPPGDGLWRRRSSVHRQRHWPHNEVRAIAGRAGLRLLAVHGQHPGAVLDPALDELVHSKAVYLACRDDRPIRGEVVPVSIGSI